MHTSLAQIVADETGVRFESVTMIIGDTAHTPDQEPTIASATIQVTSVPLRKAAAQVRLQLTMLAARALKVPAEALTAEKGWVLLALTRSSV